METRCQFKFAAVFIFLSSSFFVFLFQDFIFLWISDYVIPSTSRLIDPEFCDAKRVLLKDASEAKCIDGSPPAFYIRQGWLLKYLDCNSSISEYVIYLGEESFNWHVHFEGGGWCYSLKQCADRAKFHLGSSKNYLPCMNLNSKGYYFSNTPSYNHLLHSFNAVYVRYCDGGSYSSSSDIVYKVTIFL